MDSERFNLITVLTFDYFHEHAIISGRLETEGIEVFIKDENTIQVDPFYSIAIGGVKMQVKEIDLPQTVTFLREWGYLPEVDKQEISFIEKLDATTAKWPFFKKRKLQNRLWILLALLILVLYLLLSLVLPKP